MNERIKQLAEQAGAETWSRAPMRAVTGLAFTDENLEKFAELIVRECVQVCADRGAHHDGLYSAWADDCSKRIGKHFGVEEGTNELEHYTMNVRTKVRVQSNAIKSSPS